MTPAGVFQQLPLLVSEEQSWQVRISPRARRLSVRVYATGRVEVVTPPRVPASMIQKFVGQHRDWIAERLAGVQQVASSLELPTELNLSALERIVTVQAHHEAGAPRLRVLSPQRLLLRGELAAPAKWSKLLVNWLATRAQIEFQQHLSALAEAHGFSFQRLQIRRQRTRWGSCSSSGTISLNLCALFLRPEMLRYLMIHELCHTRHMNHSARFWRCVADCEPNYRALDRELNQAWRLAPAWIFAA